jgi:hypothetical protein
MGLFQFAMPWAKTSKGLPIGRIKNDANLMFSSYFRMEKTVQVFV